MPYCYKMLFQTLSLVLIMCLTNAFVFAGNPGELISGVLTSSNSQTVLVNSNVAHDGMTILSGTELKTRGNGAVVNLFDLGSVELAANSSAHLVFAIDRVEVSLSEGNVRLITNQGVTGTVRTKNGQVLKTDPSLPSSTVETLSTDNPDPKGKQQTGSGAGTFLGMNWTVLVWTGLVSSVAGVTTSYIFTGRGPDCSRLPAQAVSRVRPCGETGGD